MDGRSEVDHSEILPEAQERENPTAVPLKRGSSAGHMTGPARRDGWEKTFIAGDSAYSIGIPMAVYN